MSASLPSEELPRRIDHEVADELRGRLEMDVDDMLAEMQRMREDELPMHLSSLENFPITLLDDFWQEEPATEYGQTDDKPKIDTK